MNQYEEILQKLRLHIEDLDRRLNKLSLMRLFVFLSGIFICVLMAYYQQLILLWVVASFSIIIFSFLVFRYNIFEKQRTRSLALIKINQIEILRKQNILSGLPEGEEFFNRDHPYLSDLDIFGSHSIYQLLNRTATFSGSQKLAAWLSVPASKEVIQKRQEAVKELSPMLEWRQDLQVTGILFKHTKSEFNKVLSWAEKPREFYLKQKRYFLAIIPLSLLSTYALVNFIYQFFLLGNFKSIVPLLIISLINALLLQKIKSIAEGITENIVGNLKVLKGYQNLLEKIELLKPTSKLLQELHLSIRSGNSAAGEIRRLTKVIAFFQLRGRQREFNNLFYSIFNILWFLDVYLIVLTEKWKDDNGNHLRTWAGVAGEFEALSSVAGFSFSNPSYRFPELQSQNNIEFKSVGHPLIAAGVRVYNDYGLNVGGKIAMITGSNMAGKSTFLRTLGVNIVLASAGAPCCAAAATLSEVHLHSSMRTQDNLEAGVSSFYAELKRVEKLLEHIKQGQPVFFLLDEIFKGTNSKDRHRGAYSLIKQLKDLGSFGVISTHDLDLAELSGANGLVINFNFRSTIQHGELQFDYVLSNGLCEDFNASELMKKCGINIIDLEDTRKITS